MTLREDKARKDQDRCDRSGSVHRAELVDRFCTEDGAGFIHGATDVGETLPGGPGPRSHPRTLILGLGNDLVSDDGFGPAVTELCRPWLEARGDIVVETASVAGFRLLDLLSGYDRVLILDVVQTGRHPAGTILDWPVRGAGSARTLGGSHQFDLGTALALGQSLGYAMPGEITLLVAEAEDLLTIQEDLTPRLRASVPEAARAIREWICHRGAFTGQAGPLHGEPRCLFAPQAGGALAGS